jgi:hypothetical protein
MIAIDNCLSARHHLQRDAVHYEIEVERNEEGYSGKWVCLACEKARVLTAESRADLEQQAVASIDAHHLFLHFDG